MSGAQRAAALVRAVVDGATARERERCVAVLVAALDDERIAGRPYAEVVDVLVDRIRNGR